MQPLNKASSSPFVAKIDITPDESVPREFTRASDHLDKPQAVLRFEPPARQVASNTAATRAGAVQAGQKLAPDDAVVGVPMPPEAVDVLKRCFVKADGEYVVSAEQLGAAKRALLAWFGFPPDFVKGSFEKLRLDPVGETGSALDANGRCTGSIGGHAFEGWIHRNDDWSKSTIASIVEALKPLPAATSLTLHASFFERLGVTDAAEQTVITQRLFTTLSTWMTASDEDVAWAKQKLTQGLKLEGEISLSARAEGGSALADDQSIKGTVVGKEWTKSLYAILDQGIVLGGAGLEILNAINRQPHQPKT